MQPNAHQHNSSQRNVGQGQSNSSSGQQTSNTSTFTSTNSLVLTPASFLSILALLTTFIGLNAALVGDTAQKTDVFATWSRDWIVSVYTLALATNLSARGAYRTALASSQTCPAVALTLSSIGLRAQRSRSGWPAGPGTHSTAHACFLQPQLCLCCDVQGDELAVC